MSESKVILKIDKPQFTIRLYENMLKIDLKGSLKNQIEEALENKPILRQTIGSILGIFAPLHIRLGHMDSARLNKAGEVKLILPLHRDIVIPLEPKEAKTLVEKLNELIPAAKKKELERSIRERQLRKIAETEREPSHERMAAPGGAVFPTVEPPGVLRRERQAEKHIEEQETDKED